MVFLTHKHKHAPVKSPIFRSFALSLCLSFSLTHTHIHTGASDSRVRVSVCVGSEMSADSRPPSTPRPEHTAAASTWSSQLKHQVKMVFRPTQRLIVWLLVVKS